MSKINSIHTGPSLRSPYNTADKTERPVKNAKTRVFVGLSGGVDSSVTAALLKQKGYDVTGVYMKNWSKSLPGFDCPWKEDYQDAKRVAVQLGIPFMMFDFEQQYFEKVVNYLLDGFKAGITPNPDIMCNQEIKFKLFLDMCVEKGADMIATGHYAQTRDGKLLKAVDDNKDQTYFLCRITGDALEKTLFPLGQYTKPQVRALAQQFGLVTATKKESMGICFVGKVGIKEFLSQYITTAPGKVIDQNRTIVGDHEGAIFYTIGQRHGLNIGGGLPYYVTGKDMSKNEVYVTNDISDPKLWSDTLHITSVHWVNKGPSEGSRVMVRTRHRAPLVPATYTEGILLLDEPIRAITPGQSTVIYDGDVCLGGGVIF
jgi:tRNA-specific 2-thiouridylase